MSNGQDDWFDLIPVVKSAAAKQGMCLEVHLTRTSPTAGPLVRLIDRPASRTRRADSVGAPGCLCRHQEFIENPARILQARPWSLKSPGKPEQTKITEKSEDSRDHRAIAAKWAAAHSPKELRRGARHVAGLRGLPGATQASPLGDRASCPGRRVQRGALFAHDRN